MIVYAIWLLIKYIRSTTMEKIISFRLSGGLALLFGAFIKVQYAFGEKMLGIEKWWIMLIFAAFSLALGVISLSNPAFLGDSRSLIIGIMLIIEAIIDIVVFIMINNALKKNPPADAVLPEAQQKAIDAAVQSAVAAATTPASPDAAPATPAPVENTPAAPITPEK